MVFRPGFCAVLGILLGVANLHTMFYNHIDHKDEDTEVLPSFTQKVKIIYIQFHPSFLTVLKYVKSKNFMYIIEGN